MATAVEEPLAEVGMQVGWCEWRVASLPVAMAQRPPVQVVVGGELFAPL